MKTDKKDRMHVSESILRQLGTPEEIDLGPILGECMGSHALLAELIALYEKNALEFIGIGKICLQTADFRQMRLAAHKVKAGLAMMQTNNLHSIVVQIENCCKNDKDGKHLQFLFDCFTVEYPLVKNAIDEAYGHLPKH